MSILVPSNQNVQNKIRNDSFSGLEMRMNCHDWFQYWRESERQSLRVKIIIDLLPHTIHQIQNTDTLLVFSKFTFEFCSPDTTAETESENKHLKTNFCILILWLFYDQGSLGKNCMCFCVKLAKKKHRCTWKQVQTPFSPVDLYASDHFGNAYPKELSSATNHLCWRRLHLTAVVAVVTFVESAITWLGPGRGRDGARRGECPSLRTRRICPLFVI